MLAAARLSPAHRLIVAGPGYPDGTTWPANVGRIENVPASDHRAFYTSQRFTLNLTRADMIRAGYSPSVRLFEAAACAVPIVSDAWPGLDTFFRPGIDILISDSARQTLRLLTEIPERQRIEIGTRGNRRVLAEHTAEHRAVQLEGYLDESRRSNRTAAAARPLANSAPAAST
jgi:spore maturation protein CgeB